MIDDPAPRWLIIAAIPIQLLMLAFLVIAMVAMVWEAWATPRHGPHEAYPPELFIEP